MQPLVQSALKVHVALLPAVVAGALWVMPPQAFNFFTLAFSLGVWFALWVFVKRGLPAHPFEQFGLANTITAIRAAITAAIGASLLTTATLPEADSAALWIPVTAVALALILDGVDGHAARITQQESAFGARFDMEVDAMLALVIALALWDLEKCGAWVLGLGVLRYLFIAAAYAYPQLANPLFPSTRRKVVCVIQVASLSIMLAPIVQPPLSTLIGVIALVLLIGSFLRDTVWLMKNAT